MCRCGKPACFTHKQTVDPSRVILPPTAEPVSYTLDLKLRIDDHAFDGTVDVIVDVRVDGVKELVLNAKDLTVASASFGGVGDATAMPPMPSATFVANATPAEPTSSVPWVSSAHG